MIILQVGFCAQIHVHCLLILMDDFVSVKEAVSSRSTGHGSAIFRLPQ